MQDLIYIVKLDRRMGLVKGGASLFDTRRLLRLRCHAPAVDGGTGIPNDRHRSPPVVTGYGSDERDLAWRRWDVGGSSNDCGQYG
jgi:hypothetical protein